jgi:hypothetical protein
MGMTSTVEFDDQPKFMTVEIRNEGFDWNLAAKLQTKHATIAQ